MKHKFLLGLLFLSIVLMGAFVRLYRLSDIPPGVNRDEASIGWTAYSLLQTGKDEYGRVLPLSFESFGDWKLPLYIYETIIPVKAFGLNEFSVRLPSALAGIGTIILVFVLIQLLFETTALSFLTMFLLAMSPWNIHFSRTASEANMAVFLTTIAVILLVKGVKKQNWLLIPGSIFLSLGYFTYAGNYIFTTLLAILFVFLYARDLVKSKFAYIAVCLFVAMSAGIGFQTFSANHTKISGIGIFGDPSVIHAQIELPRLEHANPNSLLVRVVDNRVVFGIERFAQNYLQAFSANFLFIQGGTNHAHNIENFGNMYLIEAPFFFLGFIYLLTKRKGKNKILVLCWIAMSVIAPSLTKDAPHSARMLAIFPMLPFITAAGIWYCWIYLKGKHLLRLVLFSIFSIFFFVNILIYVDRYYVLFPRDEGQYWGIEYKSISAIITQPSNKTKQVVMVNPQWSPYIFFMFYQKFSPVLYQKSAVRYPATEDGFYHIKSYDRYTFRPLDWSTDIHMPNTILIDVPEDVPQSIREKYATKDIMLNDGKPMFTIVTNP